MLFKKNRFRLSHGFLAIAFISIATVGSMLSQQIKVDEANTLVLKYAHNGPVIDPNHADVLSSHNRSGFETGQIVKIDSVYHMFVTEMFERPHRDLRIAYWTSYDTVNWKRQSTF